MHGGDLMNAMELKLLRELFLNYLTRDSDTKDARRKDYNQAIFNKEEGWQVFCGTDLDMVMEKFDKAIDDFKERMR